MTPDNIDYNRARSEVMSRLSDKLEKKGGFEIWQINEIEAWAGHDFEEIVQAAMEQTGLPRDEVLMDGSYYKIPSSKWDGLTIAEVDEKYQPRYTYSNYLLKLCDEGQDFPCIFSSTEY